MKYPILSVRSVLLGITSIGSFVAAQIDTFSPQGQNEIFYSVTASRSTVSSGSGPIFFQIRAPTTFEWVALGQGTQMAGADIFVLYSAPSDNVTISPRSGTGHVSPQHNSDAQLSLLDGSGIQDGVMTANVRCDTCSYSDSSPWIFAYKGGASLDSDNPDADISFHDDFGGTSVTLQNAVLRSDNPFLNYDPSSPSNQPDEIEGHAGNGVNLLIAHGVIMSIAFIILFPSFGLLTALPMRGIIVKAHAPLQVLTLCLAIAGMGLGIKMGRDDDIMDDVHPVLGLIVIGLLILFQPAMGLLQHLHFRRTGGKSIFGILHRWLGRLANILGVVAGGLGFRLAGIGENPNTPTSAVIAYSVIAGMMGLVYITVWILRAAKEGAGGSRGNRDAKGMRNDCTRRISRIASSPRVSSHNSPWSIVIWLG
ncbi:cytochrome and DOMON domain-containing protein [Aspergillus undulatus]|uniref:cytochrome and DOMON domain-containing protein n=1 Tax=Aspergillus undulatus TaxID=1810928 RepID=UPI003CCDCADE